MERKLASVKKITNISPIEGADLIELATIDNGWKCVIKKDTFNVNDLCIYFEIDSFLPIIPEFNFLKNKGTKKMNGEEGYVIKTIKLRGQVSQGLVLPIKEFEERLKDINITEGINLTDILNIKKYEAPIPASLSGDVNGKIPCWIKKTDQERCQNIWSEYSKKYLDNSDEIISQLSKEGDQYINKINELKDNKIINPIKNLEFEATIKLDGTSMTCFIVDPNKFKTRTIEKELKENKELKYFFGVCSRNYELKESDKNTYWNIANKDIKEKLIKYHMNTGKNIAIQGELMGPGIQKNREKLQNHQFFCYDVWSIDEQRYFTKKEKEEILNTLKLQSVPYIENIKVFNKFNNVEELLKYAEGESLNNKVREGVVFKSIELVNGQTISFKAISNKFLLKYKE